jgi:hypothetical protein
MTLPAANATLWGTVTNPGAQVSVQLERGGTEQNFSATSDEKGAWLVNLGPVTASLEPATILIQGNGGSKTLTGVLFGVVLFCSGQVSPEFRLSMKSVCLISLLQSNMEIKLNQFKSYTDHPGMNVTQVS